MRIPKVGARAFAAVLLAMTVGLAGCTAAPTGGIPSAGGPPSAGSSSPDASSAPQAPESPDAYAYAACMRDHGIDMADPDPKTGLPTVGDSVDPESAAFKAAHEACGHLLPGGIRGEPNETDESAYLEFAQCMRKNGMPDFPDPQPGSGQGMFPGVDRNDPAFAKAAEACQDILSGSGPMSRTGKRIIIGVAVLAAAGIVVASAIGFGGTVPQVEATSTGLPPATTEVKQGTLTQTQSVSGTLSYGPTTTVLAQTDGTLTWSPGPGTVIEPGAALFKIDNDQVQLFQGKLPPYRTLSEGDSGPDVKQLEKNLAAQGYDDLKIDSYFGSTTTAAVYDWEDDHGLPEDGEVDPGQYVIASGKIRIAEKLTPVGAGVTPGTKVLSYTGTDRVVQIALAVDKQQFVKIGNPATVVLPDGTEVAGKVAGIGSVASTDAEGNTTIPVTVTIKDQSALGTLESAPVTIKLVTGKSSDVLIVPVTALVALAGGGYGVQVVSGAEVAYVAVETGMFAGGLVEISGSGIAAGTVVGVAK